jgi:hypothetical protein
MMKSKSFEKLENASSNDFFIKKSYREPVISRYKFYLQKSIKFTRCDNIFSKLAIRLTYIFIGFIYLGCTAQVDKKTYICNTTSEKITIDGKASETIWNQITPTWFTAHDEQPLKAKSWFKATWDNNYLYVLCWLEETNIQAEMTNRDDHIWHEEVMEIFIDADNNPKTYFEFEWNALNTLLDLYVLNPNCTRDVIRQWWSWDCEGIKSQVHLKGTLGDSNDTDEGWFLEVAIPFSQIQTAENIPPKKGDVWKFDLTRRDGTQKNGNLQKSSWLPPSTHFPLSYGKLIFK